MSTLGVGGTHNFASAQRMLTVLGRIAYDGMDRYRMEGDPDVHAIDHFTTRKRERALIRVGEVQLQGDQAVYLGAEFRRRASTPRTATGSEGELGDIAPFNGAIEETEYGQSGAPKFLLSIAAGRTTAWYLVTESRLDLKSFAAPSQSNYRLAELAALATYVYLAASILHGLMTKSDNHYFWSEKIQGVMVFEFILVGAGTMLFLMREGVSDRNTGKVEPPGPFVPIVFLVFGLLYGLMLFKFSIVFLIYIARLVAVMWTGFTVPAERAFEEGQRRAFGALAFIGIGMPITFKLGNGDTAFMIWGASYFAALALIELFMILRGPVDAPR